MSRITSSLPKQLTRSFSTTVSPARHSINGSIAARKQDVRPETRSTESQDPSARSIYTRTHTRPVPNPNRVVPLMQCFRTSAPRPAAVAGPPTIDCAVLPAAWRMEQLAEPVPRVPLLVVGGDRALAGHAPEAADPPLRRPEIVVVAPALAADVVTALTETEGFAVDGVELGFVHGLAAEPDVPEQGMLRDIWQGMVEDVFGGKKVTAAM